MQACRKDTDLLVQLYASIMAQACNFGLSKMAEISDISYRQLAWCTNWYLREETLQAAINNLPERRIRFHFKEQHRVDLLSFKSPSFAYGCDLGIQCPRPSTARASAERPLSELVEFTGKYNMPRSRKWPCSYELSFRAKQISSRSTFSFFLFCSTDIHPLSNRD